MVYGACPSTTIYFSGFAPFGGRREIPVKLERGCFAVDKELNVIPKGEWQGKRAGAIHKLVGRISMYDYEFESDPDDPLVFKVTKNGYTFLHGIGKIKDTANAKKYRLEKPTRIGELCKASRRGDAETVRRLLEQGVSANAAPSGGRTCLMIAAEKGHRAIAQALVSKGAKVNLQERKVKSTALMMASKRGHMEVVKLLLGAGADPNIKDKDNWTALKWAVERDHKGVEALLKRARAQH